MTQGHLDRDGRVREALYRTRVLVNRTPHFSKLDAQRSKPGARHPRGPARPEPGQCGDRPRAGIELLNRAHPSLAFGLLRNQDFADRFAPALRRLGLRGIADRLDEVPSSVMALPIPGPIGGREHRDDLPSDERLDAEGNPLPPPPYGASTRLRRRPARAIRLSSVGVEPRPSRSPSTRRQRRLEVGRAQRVPGVGREDLVRRPVQDDPPGAHDDDALERLGHEPHVVADGDHRATLAARPPRRRPRTRSTPRASWPVVGSSSTSTGVRIASTDASASSLRRDWPRS